MSERTPEQWADLYADVRPTYIAYVDKLEVLFEQLLDDAGLVYSWVQAASFDADEFERSLLRELRQGASYDDPLESRLNPTAVRIVTLAPSAVEDIVDLITREFDVDENETLTLEDAVEANEQLAHPLSPGIEYACPRLLVSLDRKRAALPEWSRYEGLRCVVDVMTLLHYAWQRFDSELPFYWATSYPARTRDAIARVAAGFASLDSELDEIGSGLEQFGAEVEDALAENRLALPIDGTTLQAYIGSYETVAQLVDTAVEAGMRRDPEYVAAPVLVEQGALWLVRRVGLRTIADLDDQLRTAAQRAPDIFGDLARISGEHGFQPWALPDSLVEWLVLVVNRMDAGTIALFDYAYGVEYALNTLIGNPVESSG